MYSIGVDVGGTGIKIGVVDESGNILYRGNCVTDVTGGFDKIISDIYDVIEDIIAQNDIEKIKLNLSDLEFQDILIDMEKLTV